MVINVQRMMIVIALFSVSITKTTAEHVRGDNHDVTLQDSKMKETQIVARFPKGITVGDCSEVTLRKLPQMCRQALTDDSPPEERLACNIITQPHTQGILPFGLYPTTMSVAKELSDIGHSTLTPIFSMCALSQMVEDGCINFRPSASNQRHTSEMYSSSEQYETMAANEYGISVEASAGYGPISVKGGYETSTVKKQSSMTDTREYQAKQVWEQVLGELSMETCARTSAIKKYLDSSYLKLWEEIGSINDMETLVYNPTFQSLMEKGFNLPVTFEYAIRYSASISGWYTQNHAESQKSIEEAITASVNVAYAGATGGISTAMKTKFNDILKNTNTKSTTSTLDVAYGDCDFKNIFSETNPYHWLQVLRDCSKNTLEDLNKLDRPSRVATGGFQNIVKVLEDVDYFSNNQLNSTTLLRAVNEYFGVCTCKQYSPSQWRKECYYPTGAKIQWARSLTGECSQGNWMWIYDNDGNNPSGPKKH